MTLDSFNLDNRFNERVTRPSAMPGIDAALFRAGMCSCPQCLSFELNRLGYNEESEWLYDRSMAELYSQPKLTEFEQTTFSDERKIELLQTRADYAISDINPMIARAMRNAAVVSDGRLNPKIAVRYRNGYRQDRHSRITRAGYRHGKGFGLDCTAQAEHDQIAYLIGQAMIEKIEADYNASVSNIFHDKPLPGSSDRRPDVQFLVHTHEREPLRVALEVQRSPLDIGTFKARHHALLDHADRVIWVFRKSGSPDNLKSKSARFRDCMRYADKNSGRVWAYLINRENQSVVVSPAQIKLIPGGYLEFNVFEYDKNPHSDAKRCTRLEAQVTGEHTPQSTSRLSEAIANFDLNLFGESTLPELPSDAKQQRKSERVVNRPESTIQNFTEPQVRQAERIDIFEAKRVIVEVFPSSTQLRQFQVAACSQQLILLTEHSTPSDAFAIRCSYAWQFDDAMEILQLVDQNRHRRVTELLEAFKSDLTA